MFGFLTVHVSVHGVACGARAIFSDCARAPHTWGFVLDAPCALVVGHFLPRLVFVLLFVAAVVLLLEC